MWQYIFCSTSGTRTRDPRRDKPIFFHLNYDTIWCPNRIRTYTTTVKVLCAKTITQWDNILSRWLDLNQRDSSFFVEIAGFEPANSWTQTKRGDLTPQHLVFFAVPTGFEPVPLTVTRWYCTIQPRDRLKQKTSVNLWLTEVFCLFNYLINYIAQPVKIFIWSWSWGWGFTMLFKFFIVIIY